MEVLPLVNTIAALQMVSHPGRLFFAYFEAEEDHVLKLLIEATYGGHNATH